MSLSADGTVLAVGAVGSNANGDDSGNVRVFQYNFDDDAWLQVGSDIIGPFAFVQSGPSVALSANGDIVTVGAPNPRTLMNNGDHPGNARVFETGVILREGDFPVYCSPH